MTGEPGHVWAHAEGYPIPRPLLAQAEVEHDRRPRFAHGPLVCVACGVPWPGVKPCERRPA